MKTTRSKYNSLQCLHSQPDHHTRAPFKMKFSILTTALLATATPTIAALCRAGGLLGIGSTSPSYQGQFYLRARSADNTVRTIVSSSVADSEGIFPLALGAANTQIASSNVPKFTLDTNRVLTPVNGNALVTKSAGLLTPARLYLAASGTGMAAQVQAVNVTCDDIARTVLRFTNLPLGALGSGTTNETFAAGAGISTPILNGLLSTFSLLCSFLLEASNANDLNSAGCAD